MSHCIGLLRKVRIRRNPVFAYTGLTVKDNELPKLTQFVSFSRIWQDPFASVNNMITRQPTGRYLSVRTSDAPQATHQLTVGLLDDRTLKKKKENFEENFLLEESAKICILIEI